MGKRSVGKRDEVRGLDAVLKAAREKAGLSQLEACAASGVHQANLSQFENGARTPTLSTLYRLAEAYGVNVCALLPGGLPNPDAAAEDAEMPPAKEKKRK